MAREQLHHREVLLERGVKGGLGEQLVSHLSRYSLYALPGWPKFWINKIQKIKKKIKIPGWPKFRIKKRSIYKQIKIQNTWVSEPPDIGDIGPSGPPAISHLLKVLNSLYLSRLNRFSCIFSWDLFAPLAASRCLLVAPAAAPLKSQMQLMLSLSHSFPFARFFMFFLLFALFSCFPPFLLTFSCFSPPFLLTFSI